MTTHQWITDFIEAHDPHNNVRRYLISTNYETPQVAWDMSERGDWMLMAAINLGALDNHAAAKISCRIVREVGDGVVFGALTDGRSRRAVEVTEAWLSGRLTLEDVRATADAAYAIAAVAYVTDAAAYAAYVAAYVAYATSAAVYAIAAVAYVADAAAFAALSVTYVAARTQIAAIVREEVPVCPINNERKSA